MRKALLTMMLLLGAVVQGAWADDGWSYYSGHESANKPEFKAWYNGRIDVCIIKTADELAYIRNHWDDSSGYDDNKDFSELNYYLATNIDMGRSESWIPLGRKSATVSLKCFLPPAPPAPRAATRGKHFSL